MASEQEITFLRPIHALCTFVWDPPHEYARTRPVSAVKASAFEDEYCRYDHISFSIGQQPYVHCFPAEEGSRRVLAQVGSSSGRSYQCIFYIFHYAGTGQG